MALVQVSASTLVRVSADSDAIAKCPIWTRAAEPVEQTNITDTGCILSARVIILTIVNKRTIVPVTLVSWEAFATVTPHRVRTVRIHGTFRGGAFVNVVTYVNAITHITLITRTLVPG